MAPVKGHIDVSLRLPECMAVAKNFSKSAERVAAGYKAGATRRRREASKKASAAAKKAARTRARRGT